MWAPQQKSGWSQGVQSLTAAPLLNAGGPDTAQAEAARYPQTSGQYLKESQFA